jgi:hypothetical protein
MSIARLLAEARVFREFPHQDSHCTSLGLEHRGRRWFVKHSSHEAGMASLRRAMVVGRSVSHPALIPLHHAEDEGDRVLLVYPFVDGEMVRASARFRALPWPERARVVDAAYDLHVQIAALGLVAVDLYDGCFLYDYDAHRPWIYDLDEYRPGPFVLQADRLPGSKRSMAPEEHVRGSRIDQVTNVYTLARLAMILLGDPWPPGALELLLRATSPDRDTRPASVEAFVSEYRAVMRS